MMIALVPIVSSFAACTAVQQPPKEGVTLTVYSSADPAGFDPQRFVAQQRMGGGADFAWQVPGFGVVKSVRRATLAQGRGTLALTDVAAFIDPTTVSIVDLTDPATAVLDQRFEFDLVSPQKLLEKYIDRPISVTTDISEHSGTLLSASDGRIVIRTLEGIEVLPSADVQVRLGSLPAGMMTRPTLSWTLDTPKGGEHLVRTAYQTGGLTWRSDYNLVIDASFKKADLGAWVTLLNLSGQSFDDAVLKLVAGSVQRVQPRQGMRMERMLAMADAAGGGGGGFEEKSFAEYHLYTLPRTVDLPQNGMQQITLFPTVAAVPVERVLVFDGTSQWSGWAPSEPFADPNDPGVQKPKVAVLVRLMNDKASGLGIPLPAGKIRASMIDAADGSMEFIGEDVIGHTPRDERVTIRIGESFDVVGERTRVDFKVDAERRTMSETVRIELRNRKQDEAATVTVRERLYRWAQWTIAVESQPSTKTSAQQVEWTVPVPAGETREVTYTVTYQW
jgi:hypothetical protein